MNRKTFFKTIGAACATIALGAFIAGCPSNNGGQGGGNAQGDTVTIGAILVQSGDNAAWGQNAKVAINLIVDDVNKKGGINGKQVKVAYQDTKGDPKEAVSAFRKLVDVEKAPVVLGDMMSSTTLAVAPLANDNKVVLLGIGSSAPAVTQAGPYVYRTYPSDVYEGEAFGEYVAKQGIKSVAVVHLNNDYGNGLSQAFQKKFKALGGKVVLEETYDTSDKDLRPIAAKVKAAKPEAVYIVGYYEDTGRAVRQMRQSGVSQRMLGTASAVSDKFIKTAGAAGEGFTAASVVDFDQEKLTPAQQEFAEKLKAVGAKPDWDTTHAADAAIVAIEAMKQGAVTGEEIKAAIDKTKKFDGVTLSLQFDENGDVVGKPLTAMQVKNGKFVPVT